MKEKHFRFLSICICFCMIIVLLITSVDIVAFRKSFYEKEYKKLNTAYEMRMEENGLLESTYALLDYLKGNRDDIIVHTKVNGTQREVFNERETLHMIDVKNLYENVITVRNVFFIFSIIGLCILMWKRKKATIWYLAEMFPKVSLFIGLFFLMLSFWASIDFTNFWISFHELFFTNDLWLLNPMTDLMIQMFPETFFFDMVIQIIVVFFATFSILLILSFLVRKNKIFKFRD